MAHAMNPIVQKMRGDLGAIYRDSDPRWIFIPPPEEGLLGVRHMEHAELSAVMHPSSDWYFIDRHWTSFVSDPWAPEHGVQSWQRAVVRFPASTTVAEFIANLRLRPRYGGKFVGLDFLDLDSLELFIPERTEDLPVFELSKPPPSTPTPCAPMPFTSPVVASLPLSWWQ